MERKSPQFKPRIKVWLLRGRTLTQQKAITLWKCYRLSVYIRRLRQDGMKIKTEMVYNKDGTQYGKYSLA